MYVPESHQPYDNRTTGRWPPNRETETKEQNGHRYATYAAYNTSLETILLPKNQIVGRCQLIFQPSEGEYLQEISAIRQEGIAEKQGLEANIEEEELSRPWVIENF